MTKIASRSFLALAAAAAVLLSASTEPGLSYAARSSATCVGLARDVVALGGSVSASDFGSCLTAEAAALAIGEVR